MTALLSKKLDTLLSIARGLSADELTVLIKAALNLRDGWLDEEPTRERGLASVVAEVGR